MATSDELKALAAVQKANPQNPFLNDAIKDPMAGSPQGDPNDPLNGYIPPAPYTGPQYAGPKPDEGTGLSGFQRGIGADPNAPDSRITPGPGDVANNPANPGTKLTPQQQQAYNAGINAPATPSAAVVGGGDGKQSLKDAALQFIGNQELPAGKAYGGYAPLLESGSPALPQNQVPGAKPVLATTGVAATGQNAAKPLSPERENLLAHTNSNDRVIDSLNADANTAKTQQEQLQLGLDTAAKEKTIREANFGLDKMSLDLARYQSDQDSKERSRVQDQTYQEQRQKKVDPQHWFKERGTVGTILAAISVGAGAFAAGMPHNGSKQNFALDIIDKAIGRDIDAQKDNIEEGWKSLNYQGHENEKAYTRNQFALQQKTDLMYKDYDHAGAMIADTIASSKDQAAITGLTGVYESIMRKKEDLVKDTADRMYQTRVFERNQAAAGGSPLSAANLEKEFGKYVQGALTTQAANPKAPGPLSREDWFKARIHGGSAGGAGGGKEAPEEVSFNKGVAGVKAAGELASKTTSGDWFLSHLPSIIAPDSNMAQDNSDKYNEGMLSASLRLLGDRVPPESIKEQTKAFQIHPGMADAVKKNRIEGYANFLRTNRAIGLGAKKGGTETTPDVVEGATPVGE